jgi:hypothetical protein
VYGSGAAFPASSWNRSNYYVDVVFVPSGTTNPPASTYTISGLVSGSSATLTLSGASSATTTTDAAGNYVFSGVRTGSYVVAASRPGYTFTPATRSVSVNGAAATGVNFTGTAVPGPVPHSVTLSWSPSTSSNVRGYNVYRAAVSGGTYVKLNASPVNGNSYVDSNVESGRTYYYVSTTVDTSNRESAYSNTTVAPVPTP